MKNHCWGTDLPIQEVRAPTSDDLLRLRKRVHVLCSLTAVIGFSVDFFGILELVNQALEDFEVFRPLIGTL
jgi:hypothetical protein